MSKLCDMPVIRYSVDLSLLICRIEGTQIVGAIQKEFDRVFNELCTIDSLRVSLFRRITEARGLRLTDEQILTLANLVKGDNDQDEVTIDVDWLSEDINITSDELQTAFKGLEADLEGRAEGAIFAVIDELPPSVLKSLYEDLPEGLRHRREMESVFHSHHLNRWKEGLDRLEMLIMVAQEAGSIYIEDVNEDCLEDDKEETLAADTCMFEALVALHARACRIASEVLCLLKGGFADGANARWRSLHEVAITALFLTQHGGDVADRYVAHAAIERWKAAEQYQEHCERLGHEPFTDDELDKIKAEADALIQKYGMDFKREYGWAATALGLKDPTFTRIEAAIDMAHWRPFFKMACQSVHAGSQALNFCMSAPVEFDGMLLAGASDAGLTYPGHSTAISLMQASSALFTFRPNVDSLIVCKCMQQLCDDIGEAFMAVNETSDAS